MDRNQILNDPETAMRYALANLQSQMWTAMPAIVQSVDLTEMTVECLPAIQGVATDSMGVQTYVNMPVLVDVPICFPSAGGFSLTFPISAGDEVLVIIAARCIDAWWQLGGVQQPIELRMNDLSDGFAIPGPRSQPRVVPGISATNAQLRNDAGTVYLEITPSGGINLVAPAGVSITGDLSVNGNFELAGMVTADFVVDGQLIASGEVTANTDSSAIHLSTHTHSGVTTGSDNTGGPNP